MGHKELLPEPDLEDRKKAKPAKPATEVVLEFIFCHLMLFQALVLLLNSNSLQVTPAQISAKAQQMVEMVKASQVLLLIIKSTLKNIFRNNSSVQVLSVEKRLAGNPLATGGLQNNVVSDKEDAKRKGKKTKKMIRVAGGQVSSPSMIIPSLYFLCSPTGMGGSEPLELGQQ